jgi:hypothetical protein
VNREASDAFTAKDVYQSDQQSQRKKSGEDADPKPSPPSGPGQTECAQRFVLDKTGTDPAGEENRSGRY